MYILYKTTLLLCRLGTILLIILHTYELLMKYQYLHLSKYNNTIYILIIIHFTYTINNTHKKHDNQPIRPQYLTIY